MTALLAAGVPRLFQNGLRGGLYECQWGKDLPEAVKWFHRAAAQGNADAQNNLEQLLHQMKI